jgi:HSP20 family protein
MANITRWDPVGEMVSLRQAMDRLFEDSFVSPRTWRTWSGEQLTPAIDVHETPEELVVTAALPGIAPEDVEITITGQNLMIRGEFKADENVERDQYLYRERRYGAFNRQLQLPVRIEGDRANATFENGLLRLTIPKAEEVKPRQIRISTDSNGNEAR